LSSILSESFFLSFFVFIFFESLFVPFWPLFKKDDISLTLPLLHQNNSFEKKAYEKELLEEFEKHLRRNNQRTGKAFSTYERSAKRIFYKLLKTFYQHRKTYRTFCKNTARQASGSMKI